MLWVGRNARAVMKQSLNLRDRRSMFLALDPIAAPNRIHSPVFACWVAVTLKRRFSVVHLAPVCNPRNAHKLRAVVNDVQDSPVTYTNAPKISVALKLPATRRPRVLTKRFHFAHGTRQH